MTTEREERREVQKTYRSASLAPCESWLAEALKPVIDQITKLQKKKAIMHLTKDTL